MRAWGMRLRCAALVCAALVLSTGIIGALLRQAQRALVEDRGPSAHERMRIQMERARAHAPNAATHSGLHEQHILTRGRSALSELGPGEEFLLTTEQLAQVLAVSVDNTNDPHELELLKIARRLPNQKTQTKQHPLSIVKTNTVPAFVMVLQARGDHEGFLLQHMRGAGQHAFHADKHEPIGAVLERDLAECASDRLGASSPSVPPLVIDAGAYFGFFGFQAAAAGCDAVLIEPQRALAPFLAASALLNGAEFAKRVQILRALISGPTLPSTTWPEHFHLVDRHGMSSYAVPVEVSAVNPPTTDTFTLDGLLRLADRQSKFKRPLHKAQTDGGLPLPRVVALKLDVQGLEVAALQGVKQLALAHGQVQNILVEFGPPAHWLRAATGVTQPDISKVSPRQRGSTQDHTHSAAIVGDPAVVASLLDEACHTLREFVGGNATAGSTGKQRAYELRWLVDTPGWRPVVAQEFALGRESTATPAGAPIEYVVIPRPSIEPVMRRLMSGRRSMAVHLWLSLNE